MRDPDLQKIIYQDDLTLYRAITDTYAYLGRVKQHHKRYYDFYARSDLNIFKLPENLVENFKGYLAPPSTELITPQQHLYILERIQDLTNLYHSGYTKFKRKKERLERIRYQEIVALKSSLQFMSRVFIVP